MFKWLPDTRVEWRDVWLGAILTAALFELGKFVIGFYIGKQGLESTYGAAASIVVVLIWIYYSAQLVLMGAEFTRSMRGAMAREEKGRWHPREPNLETQGARFDARTLTLSVGCVLRRGTGRAGG